MRKTLLITLVLFLTTGLFSVSAKTHPNEKLLVGKWRAVSVEKILPETKPQQDAATTPTSDPKTEPAGGARAGSKGSGTGTGDPKARAEEQFNRLYKAEQKSTLEIFADKTAVMDFHTYYVKATWKMKSNGKKVVAKNIKTKDKYVLEVLELTETKAVILERFPAGSLKITYARE